ncbi:hypothetical protein QZH41_015896 [Actinostola sp. cb2023]|nr:hypothetical protein QZH41_015896 [Actinostola sp. cb2023]
MAAVHLLFISQGIFGHVVAHQESQDLQFGMNSFPVGETYFSCGNITFKRTFPSSDVHVHTTLFNEDPAGDTYEAAVSWIEDVKQSGFKACAVTAGPYRDMKTLVVNWMAYSKTPQGSQSGRHTLGKFVSGTTCEEIFFPRNFGGTPDVYATPVHKQVKEARRDAATIWVEDVKPRSFKICMREMKNFNGDHKAIEVSWMAMVEKPGNWKAKEKKTIKMLNEGVPPKKQKYAFCQNSTFDYKFYKPPIIITSVSHIYDKNNPRSISPFTNSMSNWIEKLDVDGFQVCMKDGQKLRGKHTQLDIQFLALGDLDPCIGVICSFYGRCVAYGPSDARCACDYTCPTYENMLCSAAGITYDNECLFKKNMCKNKENIGIAHAGSCRPFILQRGRTQVSLDITDVKCTDVTYNSSEWYTSLPIHVLITVNYDGESSSIVHHAITSWVEKVSHSKFTTCALKAGRNEHEEGTVPPMFGRTYIDWIAFQGSPKGGVVGEQVISDWWEGTTCKSLSLPSDKFASSPYVLLTAEHTRIGLKHDAATLWTEDVTSRDFKVCMRELQNFDGIHRSINVNWMAFKDLPRNLFSEHSSLHFANTGLPLASSRHAYCKFVEFQTSYHDVPTVLLSATHNSTRAGALPPKHNSIASWIEVTRGNPEGIPEDIDKHGFRACIKELHEEGNYDPVDVHWVALPECNRPLVATNRSVVSDSRITASSQLAKSTPPRLARITADPKTNPSSWCASTDVDQWLQVDLGHLYYVSGVATQGSYAKRAWVTSYRLSYSKDNVTFSTYKENSLIRVSRNIHPLASGLRACGLAGLRACGLAGLRACGLAGLRACGLAGLRACGLAGLRACGLAGLRACGLAGLRACGLAGLRACGLAGLRA